MVTFTGKYIDPWNLKPEDIDIRDIAAGLSKCCRFAGQCSLFYSVAEHSVRMSYQLPNQASHHLTKQMSLIALLHDAPEAYLGDMVRCIKVGMADYKMLEEKVWRVIMKKFGFNFGKEFPLPAAVHEADMRMLVTERKQVINEIGAVWDLEKIYDPYPNVEIEGWYPIEAELLFLNRFQSLTDE